MTDRHDSILDDWLPEDDEFTDGSYDLDYDFAPTESEPDELLTIDDYPETGQKEPDEPDDNGLFWVYWR